VRKKGFTLIESLIGMALSLFIISSGLEFFGLARKVFFQLKEREEAGQAALAAIDRMRIDLLHAGCGLAGEMDLGLVEAVEASEAELRTVRLEKALTLAREAHSGDTRILLASTADIASGQKIALRGGLAGEVRTVARVEAGAVILDPAIVGGYAPATAAVSLIESVAYFLDGPQHMLRRRVNAASAQPVVENVAAASWSYDAAARLARIRLESDIEGAHPHEATVFLKNPALAGTGRR
jgi:prepilin-type N-terminal cleavage/methylation domain-containing protein